MKLINFPLRAVRFALGFIFRILLVLIIVIAVSIAGFVVIKGSQPIGMVGADPNGNSGVLGDMNYWEYMANRLQASSETPANCHRTRLVYLAIALPVYPAIYTYVALFPESSVATHMQPSPLIPESISWREAPETWWQLVKEISWLAFTEPQRDYTPAIGQVVRMDQNCVLPSIPSEDTQ
jgi:hypothetical protein